MYPDSLRAEVLSERLLPASEQPFAPCFAAPSLIRVAGKTPRLGSVTPLRQVPVGPYHVGTYTTEIRLPQVLD